MATVSCKMISGGVTNAHTMNKIKYVNVRVLHKSTAVIIPKLVKNMRIIRISNNSANEITTRDLNLKYHSTGNNSLMAPSFKDNKNGKINLINIKYPKTKPIRNKMNIAGM